MSTATPSRSGSPRSSRTTSGIRSSTICERRPTVAGRLDLVVAGAQVDRQRAPHRGVVVDDQDEGHLSSCRSGSTVAAGARATEGEHQRRAAAGVSVAIGATHRLGQPARDGEAETRRPSCCGTSPNRWNGREEPVAISVADPGARVGDPHDDAVRRHGGVDHDAGATPACTSARSRRCWRAPGRAGRRRRARRCRGRRPPRCARPRPAARCSPGPRPRGRPRARATLTDTGADAAHVEQVGDERGQPVGRLLDRERAARPRPRRDHATSVLRRLPTDDLHRRRAGCAGRGRPQPAAPYASGRPRPAGAASTSASVARRRSSITLA